MYRIENNILRRQFGIGAQGYNVVKILVYLYALNELGINYEKYDRPETTKDVRSNTPDKYMMYIHEIITNNLDRIDKELGCKFGSIIRDCIVSFDNHYMTGSGLTSAIIRASHMTNEEIVSYITEEANTVGLGRDDYSTPDTLSNLVVKLLHSKDNETWYDLGSGHGDFLLKVGQQVENCRLYGCDINYDASLLANIRLFFFNVNATIREQDIIFSICDEPKVDCAFGNFPLAYRLYNNRDDFNSYNRFVLPVMPKHNLDWIFIDRLLQTLNSNGRAIAVVANGTLSNSLDYAQRKNAVENNFIEGVISLPGRLFNYTMIATSLIIFNKQKSNTSVKLLDATNMIIEGRRMNELKVEEIVDSYNCAAREISIEEIHNNDYSLCVSTYVDLADVKLENEHTIGDVALDVFRGYQFTADQLNETITDDSNVYRVLSVGDLQDGSFFFDRLHEVSIEEKRASKFQVQNGDIILAARATTMKTAIVEISDEKVVASGSVIVIRCNSDIINPVYLKAFLDSKTGQKLISSVQSGTGIISLNANAVKKIRIPLFERDMQEEVAAKYLKTQDMIRVTRLKLEKLEKQITNIYDDAIGGVDIA